MDKFFLCSYVSVCGEDRVSVRVSAWHIARGAASRASRAVPTRHLHHHHIRHRFGGLGRRRRVLASRSTSWSRYPFTSFQCDCTTTGLFWRAPVAVAISCPFLCLARGRLLGLSCPNFVAVNMWTGIVPPVSWNSRPSLLQSRTLLSLVHRSAKRCAAPRAKWHGNFLRGADHQPKLWKIASTAPGS